MSEDELLLKAFTVLNRKADRLQALKEAELDKMPVNKFLAHHDVYAGQPMRNRLSNAAKKLCASEITTTSDVGVKLKGTGMTHAKLISESGLYKLVCRC